MSTSNCIKVLLTIMIIAAISTGSVTASLQLGGNTNTYLAANPLYAGGSFAQQTCDFIDFNTGEFSRTMVIDDIQGDTYEYSVPVEKETYELVSRLSENKLYYRNSDQLYAQFKTLQADLIQYVDPNSPNSPKSFAPLNSVSYGSNYKNMVVKMVKLMNDGAVSNDMTQAVFLSIAAEENTKPTVSKHKSNILESVYTMIDSMHNQGRFFTEVLKRKHYVHECAFLRNGSVKGLNLKYFSLINNFFTTHSIIYTCKIDMLYVAEKELNKKVFKTRYLQDIEELCHRCTPQQKREHVQINPEIYSSAVFNAVYKKALVYMTVDRLANNIKNAKSEMDIVYADEDNSAKLEDMKYLHEALKCTMDAFRKAVDFDIYSFDTATIEKIDAKLSEAVNLYLKFEVNFSEIVDRRYMKLIRYATIDDLKYCRGDHLKLSMPEREDFKVDTEMYNMHLEHDIKLQETAEANIDAFIKTVEAFRCLDKESAVCRKTSNEIKTEVNDILTEKLREYCVLYKGIKEDIAYMETMKSSSNSTIGQLGKILFLPVVLSMRWLEIIFIFMMNFKHSYLFFYIKKCVYGS